METILKKTIVMNYKTIIITSLALMAFGQLKAQSESEVHSFIRSASVEKETSLEISNKYGAIHITPWNKDSVLIRAEVKAFAPNQAKLKKMFDGVTINITESRYLIRAQTEFTQNINMLFESFKGMTSKLISYDSRVEINYYINIPDYINLKIENKYGDVYMEDNTGKVSISVSNGSFKANSLGKESSITLVFCDATINSIISGKIDASFSELTIGEAEDLSVNSISSRYEIKKAGFISSESRRDKFYIENVEILKGNSYFTDYKISNLKKEIDLTTMYGSINADFIEKRFEEISINSGYSDISLRFETGSSYNFDIRHINSFLVLPDKDIKTEQKTLNEDKKELMTFGTAGKNPGTTKVKIDATRGNIYLK
jgi:hypothetical protein